MNDYYNYLNGFTDMNYMTNPNNMIGDLNYQSLMPNLQTKGNEMSSVLDSYEGFKRGNMFGNLYDPYKKYKPDNLNPKNERETLLYQVMQYKFALIELNLYLDNNPNNTEMIKLYNKYFQMSIDTSAFISQN